MATKVPMQCNMVVLHSNLKKKLKHQISPHQEEHGSSPAHFLGADELLKAKFNL
jgi:hypothetical protein